MRRLNNHNDGSLELLLDTICNTFGGILFISMLVVTLLNITSESVQDSPPTQVTQLQLIEMDLMREQVSTELERLRRAVEAQGGIDSLGASDEIARLAERVQRLEALRSRLVSDKSTTVGRMSKAQVDLNEIKKDAEERKQEILAGQKKVATLNVKLVKSVEDRSQKATVPKVTQTTAPWSTWFLIDGKLYGPRYHPGGDDNTTDFIETTSSGVTFIDPNPRGGIAVDASGNNRAPLISKVRVISSSGFFVKLFVWPNSFEHCGEVRNVVQQLGMKIELVLIPEGQRIRTGSGPSGPSNVQ